MGFTDLVSEKWFALQVRRKWPSTCRCIVLDFDGVLTDDRVITTSAGIESVVCSRSDGYGVEMLRAQGFRLLVLSREVNSVVEARCIKLSIEAIHGVTKKLEILESWCAHEGYSLEDLCYVGNDVNDLECLAACGIGLAVHDAHRRVVSTADLVIPRRGGRGAIRLLAESLAGV